MSTNKKKRSSNPRPRPTEAVGAPPGPRPEGTRPTHRNGGHPAWALAAVAALAVVAAIWAYSPAMNGPFLFDDNFLPFGISTVAAQPLSAWLHSQRPLLMATYWLSVKLSPGDTWWFHFMNVIFHLVTTGLVFLIVRKLVEWARVDEARRDLLAGVAALLFLLHPLQTEAVAYLAGRSEGFSVMLAFAAFTVFLYRRGEAATWPTAAAVFLLFAAALLAKEHTIALPALLLLTDYWWAPGFSWQGARRNWRIYAPMAVAAAAGAWFFRNLIAHATTAGFGLKEFTWYQYFFTQCRALFVYIGLFLFPVHQSADWDFAISRTVLDRGAIAGLLALAALAAAAWRWRRRFPLASYGYFVFLVLMAPTSSVLPIKDPIAERRLYFSILGLLLIVVEVLARVRVDRKVLAAAGVVVALAAAAATHARAAVWSGALVLWQDTAAKSPNHWRPHFHLGFAYFSEQRCDLAVAEYEKTAALNPPEDFMADLLVDWGLAYDCLNQPQQALAKLQQAAVKHPTAHVLSQIAMIYGKNSQWLDALAVLAAAQQMDPNYPETYVYRGIVYTKMNQWLNAIEEYRRALALDPANEQAQKYLQIVMQQLRQSVGQ